MTWIPAAPVTVSQPGKGTRMFRKTFSKTIVVGHAVLTVVLGCAALLGQQTPAAPSFLGVLEFPVIMRQNVAAGTTPVGTKVEAKLAVATLVDGVVVPRDAVFSGEVTESVAKSATDPSRLAIRMDSAQWKKGSGPVVLSLASKVYLTAWYYPVATLTNENLEDASQGAPENAPPSPRRRNRDGTNSRLISPASQPLPAHDTGSAPPAPESSISQRRALMENVESTRNSDGAVALTSKSFNIKLDKITTYVLAKGDLLRAN
jgi:hypothetical protein